MSEFNHTPDVVKHGVFCHIFPDRFAKSEFLDKPTHIEPWDSPPNLYGFKCCRSRMAKPT